MTNDSIQAAYVLSKIQP